MVGGEEADVAAARPILEAIRSNVVHVGPAGSGQTVKAANQLIVAGTIQLVAEAGLPRGTRRRHPGCRAGTGGIRILDRKSDGMRARQFQPGFRVDLHHKDLDILAAAARVVGVATPVGALVAQLMGALRAQGHGSLDHSALLLLVEQLSGRHGAGAAPHVLILISGPAISRRRQEPSVGRSRRRGLGAEIITRLNQRPLQVPRPRPLPRMPRPRG